MAQERKKFRETPKNEVDPKPDVVNTEVSSGTKQGQQTENEGWKNPINIPQISLPKSGGAIKGIGEKFQPNPFTGTASLNVPIYTSSGRSGFGPQLGISYNSGGGNGIFGLGWGFSIPSITRKTEKELPRYLDYKESDTFILSGSEDLVPAFKEGTTVLDEIESNDNQFIIKSYKPRTEGLFARIEKWIKKSDKQIHFWRTVTKDNVTSIYGNSENARIVDKRGDKTFSWLIAQQFDDKGNLMVFEYEEDAINEQFHEQAISKYIKKILYGNSEPVNQDFLYYKTLDYTDEVNFHFRVIFDYGTKEVNALGFPIIHQLPEYRLDAFSIYSPGFELRTRRLCHRVLMFHHFPDEGLNNQLVKSTNFTYNIKPEFSTLTGVEVAGYDGSVNKVSKLPPLEFKYSEIPILNNRLHSKYQTVNSDSLENCPQGLSDSYQLTDLDAEGIPGILFEENGCIHYKKPRGFVETADNIPELSYHSLNPLSNLPSTTNLQSQQLQDIDGDGCLELVQFDRSLPGFYTRTDEEDWDPFIAFKKIPNINWGSPHLRFLDLNGDGRADILFSEDERFVWYPSLAKDGYDTPETFLKRQHEKPTLLLTDRKETILLADMSGDGLQDIVRISKMSINYWPNMGYARFGEKITMSFPGITIQSQFDPSRIRLADVDGSGTTDIVYLDNKETKIFFNQAGNSFSQPVHLNFMASTDNHTSVQIADITGNGTGSIIWSNRDSNKIHFIDLMGGRKPHLLTFIENNLGGETRIEYSTSTKQYLADKENGKPWVTRLPFPVQVIKKIIISDRITNTSYTSTYSYHHGYFDGEEREFRGFGRVEQVDTDTFTDSESDQLPVKTISWFHTGSWKKHRAISQYFREDYHEYFKGDTEAWFLQDTILPENLTIEEEKEACRVLRGQLLRQEVYALDRGLLESQPYTATETNFQIRCIQKKEQNKHGVFLSYSNESLAYHYERNNTDPRILHQLTLEVDNRGNITRSASIAYPRRKIPGTSYDDEQINALCSVSEQTFTEIPNLQTDELSFLHSIPVMQKEWEFKGFQMTDNAPVILDDFHIEFNNAQVISSHIDIQDTGLGLKKKCIQELFQSYRAVDETELAINEITIPLLPYQTYQKAFTPEIFSSAFSGLGLTSSDELVSRGKYVDMNSAWWTRSGIQKFDNNNFFLPYLFISPFSDNPDDINENFRIFYDTYNLLAEKTIDPTNSEVNILQNDYRFLQAKKIADQNDIVTEVSFNAMGMVTGTALIGKTPDYTYDSLSGFDPNFDNEQFLSDPVANAGPTLNDATSCIAYDLFRYLRTKNEVQPQPVIISTISREIHGSNNNHWQIGIAYQDGIGRDLQSRLYADAGGDKKWITSGRVVYNNKGNPVQQFEPFYTHTHDLAPDPPDTVSSRLYYDPVGRLFKTVFPDDTFSYIEFNAWKEKRYDRNDTSPETQRYTDGSIPQISDPEPADKQDRAAWLAIHHANTPAENHLDVLARNYKSVQVNENNERYITRVIYNITGNPVKIFDPLKEISPARPPAMETTYDMMGNAICNMGMDNGDKRVLMNVSGNPVLTSDSMGHLIRYEYDKLMRPVRKLLASDNNKLVEKTVYGEPADRVWNGNGQVKELYDGAGKLESLEFDGKGNLLRGRRQLLKIDYSDFALSDDNKITHDWSNTSALEEKFLTHTSYDALNRPYDLLLLIDKNNVVVPGYRTLNKFNQAGQLNEVNSSRKRNAVTDGDLLPYVKDIIYNVKGQREKIVYANDVGTHYTYDPVTFRLVNLKTQKNTNSPLQDIYYTYDPVGNITEIEDKAQRTVYHNGTENKPICRYRYDALYRLIQAEGREHINQNDSRVREEEDFIPVNPAHPNDQNALRYYKQNYHYDQNGNITRMDHKAQGGNWARIYTYASDSNQLLETSNAGNTPAVSFYAHDPNGNMLTMPHLSEMKWDHHDRLIKTITTMNATITNPGGTAWYLYGADGQRIRKIFKASNTTYKERIYLGGFEIFKEHVSGVIKNETETFHIMDDENRIAMQEHVTIKNNTIISDPVPLVRFQLNNHLNSSHLEVDLNGVVISYEEYHPYGTTSYSTRNNAISQKRYRYTGKEKDEETGLYYYGARYYAAWLGRWCSTDPAGFVDGVNLYAYTKNNPINLYDQNGLNSEQENVPLLIGDPNAYTKLPPPPDKADYNLEDPNERQLFESMTQWWNEELILRHNERVQESGKGVLLTWAGMASIVGLGVLGYLAAPLIISGAISVKAGAMPAIYAVKAKLFSYYVAAYIALGSPTGQKMLMEGVEMLDPNPAASHIPLSISATKKLFGDLQKAYNKMLGTEIVETIAPKISLNKGFEVVGEQVHAKLKYNKRIIDVLGKYYDALFNIEFKHGDAIRPYKQVLKDEELASTGGRLVGKNIPDELKDTLNIIETIVINVHTGLDPRIWFKLE